MPLPVDLRDSASLAFRHSPRAAIIVAPDAPRHTIVDVNAAFVALKDRSRDALIGMGLLDTFPGSVGAIDDRTVGLITHAMQDAMAGRPAALTWKRHDHVGIGAGGFTEQCWQLSTVPIRDDAGELIGLLNELEDVTAREHAAQEARTIAAAMEQTPTAICVTRGPDHRLVIVNRVYERFAGRSGRTGARFSDAHPELAGRGLADVLDHVYASAQPFTSRELFSHAENDSAEPAERVFDFMYQPLLDVDGHISGILQRGVDVTDQVRAWREVERLLRESEEVRAVLAAGQTDRDRLLELAETARTDAELSRTEAEVASRAKGEFLAVMSHELRTPLNAIDGYAELMELGIHGPLTGDQRKDLSRIRICQRHLLGLINGVLNYSRVEAGAEQYRVERVRIDELLATCEALTAPQIRAKQLDFRLSGCDHAVTANADAERVQQIVLNLLSNAVKFTDPRGRVRMECEIADDRRVLVHISDTGRGIPEDQLDRVFQPFVQVDAKLTRTHEGTGLGLAISRELARGMGGDITLQSAPGKGSTFTLILPGDASVTSGTGS